MTSALVALGCSAGDEPATDAPAGSDPAGSGAGTGAAQGSDSSSSGDSTGGGGGGASATGPAAPGADGGSPDAGMGTAGGATPRCDPSKPFQAPVRVPGLDGHHATFTADELTVFYSYARADIYTAKRSSRTAAFSAGQPVAALNTTGTEDEPSITADGLAIYFSRGAGDGIYRSTRTSTTSPFGAPTRVATSDRLGITRWAPFVSADGKTLLYVTERDSGSSSDLWWRPVGGAEASIANVNSPSIDRTPVLSADGLTLIFASTRDSTAADPKSTFSDGSFYSAHRTSTAATFGAPKRITELGTLPTWVPSWLSPDGCVLYMNKIGFNDPQTSMAVRPL